MKENKTFKISLNKEIQYPLGWIEKYWLSNEGTHFGISRSKGNINMIFYDVGQVVEFWDCGGDDFCVIIRDCFLPKANIVKIFLEKVFGDIYAGLKEHSDTTDQRIKNDG